MRRARGAGRGGVFTPTDFLDVAARAAVDQALSRALDEMARHEDITTGVILTPNSQYFPVSIERFIASVLEDEFSV